MGRAASIQIPTEEQIKFYEQILDEKVLQQTIAIIESLLNKDNTYVSLRDALRIKFGYDNIEELDHYHSNRYFDSNYKSIEKDSCDFLMIGIWADFNKRVDGLDDILAAVQVTVVWNDIQHRGCIRDVTIFYSKSRAYFMKPLCAINLGGEEIINWKWKGKLPIPKVSKKEERYTDSSHITNIDELKQFISFLIHEEKIPNKIHAFERFGNLVHPKTGFALFNEYKANLYTRLLDEGYTTYIKLRRMTSFDTYIMELQRKARKSRKK